MFQAMGSSAHPALPRVPPLPREKAQHAIQQPSPPLLPAYLPPRSQNPAPWPPSICFRWRSVACPSKPPHHFLAFCGCVCSYGFSPSLIPQSGDCSTSGPWRFVRDASQRTGVSLLEEVGERSYFMGKETAAAKKDTELLGTAGGAGG